MSWPVYASEIVVHNINGIETCFLKCFQKCASFIWRVILPILVEKIFCRKYAMQFSTAFVGCLNVTEF